MSQSLAKINIHVVYSVQNRASVLDETIRPDLYAYTVGILNKLACITVAVGGTADHLHALIILSRTVTVAKVIEDMKRGSSRWLKARGWRDFAWQNGYGAFSVSESKVTTVAKYIHNQQEHHRRRSFTDELRSLLKKHNVEFDERYIFS
ncbi:MAG: IS200/IS605 family transposase [Planctomycetota bacterium]|jgi:REP element-mobilizing transposase RayT|nr:IS200/IS605 family transposase [Planctomycetota bacterium]